MLYNFTQNTDELISLKELLSVGWLANSNEESLSTVFEDNGQLWAHYSCALWSDSVNKDEKENIMYVDKAVCEGLFQVRISNFKQTLNLKPFSLSLLQQCSFCDRFGATINCMMNDCKKVFHYPCASISGCFQDIKQFKLL